MIATLEVRTDSLYRAVSPMAALAICAVASAVLFGWMTGNEHLKRVFPAMVAMNPLTAVTFILAGCQLWLTVLCSKDKWMSWARNTTAMLVAIVGAAKLADLALGTSLRLDEILFSSQLHPVGQIANRMAPNTALCFLLSGISLLLLTSQRTLPLVVAQSISVLVILLSLVAVVGYAYGISALYGVGTFIPMALPTATSFFVLSGGILFSRPGNGLMSIVTSNTGGGVIARLLLPAAIMIPVAIGWLPLAGQRAGFFNIEVGVVLFVVANVLVLISLIWWNATLLYSSDMKRQAAERELIHNASHDALTGLVNRAQFMKDLTYATARARRSRAPLAVLYIDLDGFKEVNDTLGHLAGDQLLTLVADRLRSCARAADLCARLGGDEFTLLSEGSSVDGLQVLASRIVTDLSQPYDLEGRSTRIGTSIGIAIFNDDTGAEALLLRADAALYVAKRNGKGRYEVAV